MVTTASMEYPPAAHEEAPLSILRLGPAAAFGLRSRSISSDIWTIFGGRTFHLQNPESTYSLGRPLDSAYECRWSSHLEYSSGCILPVFLHSLDRHEGQR